MIRLLILAFTALFFLASCTPAVDTSDPYTSQRYAEEVSEDFFRFPDGRNSSNKSRRGIWKRTVVPVQAGKTVVVEQPST